MQTFNANAAEQTHKLHQDMVTYERLYVYCGLSQASANSMMRTGIPCSGSDLRNLAQICIGVRRLRTLMKLLIFVLPAVCR
jgi:hypothetical protein